MTVAASLLARLDRAVRQAVAAGDIGAAKSMRLHIGAPADQQPDSDTPLALGDAIFACQRLRVETMDGEGGRSTLCVWEQGQIGTITSTISDPSLVVLAVLGQGGALHFQHQGD